MFKLNLPIVSIIFCAFLSTIAQSSFASSVAIKEPFTTNNTMHNWGTELEEDTFESLNPTDSSDDEPFHIFEPRDHIEDPINVIENGTLAATEIINPINEIKNVGNLRVLTTITTLDEFKKNQKYVYSLMESYNKPVCIIDTETTGTYKYIDRLIQLAVMKFSFIDNGKKVKIEITNQYFNPGDISISKFAFKAHKLDKAFLSRFQNFDHYKNGVINMLNDSIWLAHNVGFDFWKLREELERVLPENSKMSIITKCSLKKARRDNKRRLQYKNNLTLDGQTFESPAAKQKYIKAKTEEFFKEKEEYAYKMKFVNKLTRQIKNLVLSNNYIINNNKAFIHRLIKEEATNILEIVSDMEDIKSVNTDKYLTYITNTAEGIKTKYSELFTNNEDLATSSSSSDSSSDESSDFRSPSSDGHLLSQSSNGSSNSLTSLSSEYNLDKNEFFNTYFGKNMKDVAKDLNIPEQRIIAHDAFYDITMLESLIRNNFIVTKHPNSPAIDEEYNSKSSARIKREREFDPHLQYRNTKKRTNSYMNNRK